MPENGGAYRSGDEADGVNEERLKSSDQRVGFWKKLLCKHQPRYRAVQEKVVPLDFRPHRAGNDGTNEHGAVR